MVSLKAKYHNSEFYRIFNMKDALAVGRSMLLFFNFMASILNVFITGVFYTGFLAYSGIDIVRVGIISFIPYITWIFSLLAPSLFTKVKRRRALMLFSHVFYFTCVVIATTVIPGIVSDQGQRTMWFALFLFIGNAVNSLLSPGVTAWHMRFLPDGYDRNVYFAYINLITSFVGTFVAIAASLVIDSFGAAQQGQIIVTLRYIAGVVFILSGLPLFLVPKEFPYKESEQKVRISQILTVPLREKKFMLTAVFVILWNLIANVNVGTWNYYVLNTVGINYTIMNIGAAVLAVGSIFFLRSWRVAIIRYTTFPVVLFTVFVTGILEVLISFSTRETQWVFIVASILQGLIAVGRNLVFANLFYINLPPGNTDIFITFWNFTANIAVLIGSALGTWFLALVEPFEPVGLLGLPFYGSQFLVWIKFLLFMLLCVYLYVFRCQIQPDSEGCPSYSFLRKKHRSAVRTAETEAP